MNITEALNAALPEMPARRVLLSAPRLDPGFTVKEHIEDGKRIYRVYIPSSEAMFKLPPPNWALVQLFDGKRSYEEIAQLYSERTGSEFGAEAVREFAGELDALDFWYKTPQEKNILFMQKSREERQKSLKTKKKYGDLSLYAFPAVNPDKFLTWLVRYTDFIYTPWFTALTLCAFAFTGWITITHWSEIGRDTLEFFNFTHKSWADFIQFYLLAVFVLCVHEIAHGHACKHYGGRVPAMGFALIYLSPAFYTDTTEGLVKGSRYQRLVISVAGVWSELMMCAIATPIWWNTPPDTLVHNSAYIVMMISGISAVIVNWNPLMKLDGYHMMCEILGLVDLKEASTAYASAWVRRYVWRLPVEVPYVPKRWRVGYFVYAFLSGLYCYSILYIVAIFVGNIFRNFSPEWSFIPELGAAALIFRSRIVMLGNFMKFVYLDKKDRVRAWFTPFRTATAFAALGILAFIPIRREAATGPFILEPAQRAMVRAVVPGVVTGISAEEGSVVEAGMPLVELRNSPLQLTLAHSVSDQALAAERATAAEIRYRDFGPLARERERLLMQTSQLASEISNLQLLSPISGTVLTPRPQDKVGSFAAAGTDLVEIADLTALRARVYLSEHDLYKIHDGSAAQIEVDGIPRKWHAESVTISASSSEIDPALAETSDYTGLQLPTFYVATLVIENPEGALHPGMQGNARIFGQSRSIAGSTWEAVDNFVRRKVW